MKEVSNAALLKLCVSWTKILFICAVILFPKAKINLGLRVLGPRQDGFHEISSLMIPIPLQDVLEFRPGGQSFRLHLSGRIPEGEMEDNLVMKAARLIQDATHCEGGEIWLHKAIPSGAGLGGGSADAAAMLQLLKSTFSLPVHEAEMHSLALSLGSDCPFFLQEDACWISGRGEVLNPATLTGKTYAVVLIKPGQGISTALAYKNIHTYSLEAFDPDAGLPPESEWEVFFQNDFQDWAIRVQPEIGGYIAFLKEMGAFYAAMSGSGSSVFGLFRDKVPAMKVDEGVFCWKGKLRI